MQREDRGGWQRRRRRRRRYSLVKGDESSDSRGFLARILRLCKHNVRKTHRKKERKKEEREGEGERGGKTS